MSEASYPKAWTKDDAKPRADQTPISDEEKARRHAIVSQATHSLTLEGLKRSDESLRVALLWADGKITMEEKSAMVRASLLDGLSGEASVAE